MSVEQENYLAKFRKQIVLLAGCIAVEFVIWSILEYFGRDSVQLRHFFYFYAAPIMKIGIAVVYLLLILSAYKIKREVLNPLWDRLTLMLLLKMANLIIGVIIHVVSFWTLHGTWFLIGFSVTKVFYSSGYVFEMLSWLSFGKYISEFAESVPTNLRQVIFRSVSTMAYASIFFIPHQIIFLIWFNIDTTYMIVLQVGFLIAGMGMVSYLRNAIRVNMLLNPNNWGRFSGMGTDQNANPSRTPPNVGIPTKPTPHVAQLCPKCGSALEHGEEFCVKCGWDRAGTTRTSTQKCPSCGELLGNEKDFCMKCGWKQ